jgi:hypothetical protein
MGLHHICPAAGLATARQVSHPTCGPLRPPHTSLQAPAWMKVAFTARPTCCSAASLRPHAAAHRSCNQGASQQAPGLRPLTHCGSPAGGPHARHGPVAVPQAPLVHKHVQLWVLCFCSPAWLKNTCGAASVPLPGGMAAMIRSTGSSPPAADDGAQPMVCAVCSPKGHGTSGNPWCSTWCPQCRWSTAICTRECWVAGFSLGSVGLACYLSRQWARMIATVVSWLRHSALCRVGEQEQEQRTGRNNRTFDDGVACMSVYCGDSSVW